MDQGWDYVIVGAGSAGCVLADRLSADPSVRVLLVEEGTAGEDLLTRMPKGFARILADPARASYAPTAYRRESEGAAPDIWIRGKSLGGSSSTNGMVWMRGQPEDYDRLTALGLRGWSWRDMLPCFRALENHVLGDDGVRGVGGPVGIRPSDDSTPLAEALLRAGEALGLPRRADINGLNQEGLGYLQCNIDSRGRRISAARALLLPAMQRPNLTVESGVKVGRVLFEGGRAVAVEGRRDGRPVTFRTGGEIVLSAGALASPAILQRSGIGPADLLARLGIPLVHESPLVGRNMREHWLLQLQFRLKRKGDSQNHLLQGPGLLRSIAQWFLLGSGALATGPYHVGGFVRSRPEANRPDAQVMFMPTSQDFKTGRVLEAEPGMQMFAYQCRPESTGSLAITAADPDAPLHIEPNYHAAAEDRAIAVEMIRWVRRLAATPPLSDLVVEETDRTAWARTDEQILEAFRLHGTAGFHACGTCAMGAGEDAVLDDRLRVRGVTGLRVMDVSVFPEMVSGNTNAPVMAMAWRAAQLMLAERADAKPR